MPRRVTLCLHGEDLDAMDRSMLGTKTSSDPYVVIKDASGRKIAATEVIQKNLNPVWGPVVLEMPDEGSKILLECWDKDLLSCDDLIGTAEVQCSDLLVAETRIELKRSAGMMSLVTNAKKRSGFLIVDEALVEGDEATAVAVADGGEDVTVLEESSEDLSSAKDKLLSEFAYFQRMLSSTDKRSSDGGGRDIIGYLSSLKDRITGHSKSTGPSEGSAQFASQPPECVGRALGAWAVPLDIKPDKVDEPERVNAWFKQQIKIVDDAQKQQVAKMQESVQVKREELNNIGLACNRLWHLDSNRLVPGKHYRLDLQKGKNAWASGDFAARPLFEWVDERALQERPTFGCFLALLDNYFAETGRSEEVTGEESRENEAFLDECLKTGPIKYLYNYLVAKRRVNSRAAFKSLLHNLWFKLYRRVVRDDSSGFEHVFVGEIRDGEVIGMHSWLQLYNEERNGRLDYQGFIRPKRRGTNALKQGVEDEHVQTIQFKWGGRLKRLSTSFIGTSPEFELALYTLCFVTGQETNRVRLGSYNIIVTCHKIARDKIGTSHPQEAPLTDDEAATKIQGRFRTQQQRSEYKKSNNTGRGRRYR